MNRSLTIIKSLNRFELINIEVAKCDLLYKLIEIRILQLNNFHTILHVTPSYILWYFEKRYKQNLT